MPPLHASEDLPIDPAAVIALAREAGHLIVSMQARGLAEIRTKSTEIDLVTEADVASERFLSQGLAALAPQIDFWGEETNQAPNTDYFWIVDPIDGTVNYAAGVPIYSISIALNRGDETLFGWCSSCPAPISTGPYAVKALSTSTPTVARIGSRSTMWIGSIRPC